MSDSIRPGAMLGVFGGGQLGRMFALAARQMGYRIAVLAPHADSPAGQVADRETVADYADPEAVEAFARQVAAVTFEFENVDPEAAAAAARHVPVRPSGDVLRIAQNRLREKRFLARNGFATAAFEYVGERKALAAALARIGVPAVLKTAGFGYDGKGQALIHSPDQAEPAWAAIGGEEAILEAFVDFEREVSVVMARGADGGAADFGVVENRHRDHILDCSMPDAPLPPTVLAEARRISGEVLAALDAVGVVCVEFFVTGAGQLLVNEIAPRPHNSGHFSIDACATSQFEQQVRALCALPLGSTERLRPCAMVNLLGELWADGEPSWEAALADPEVRLHLYGKAEPRPGRKMGHLLAFDYDRERAAERALAARGRLQG